MRDALGRFDCTRWLSAAAVLAGLAPAVAAGQTAACPSTVSAAEAQYRAVIAAAEQLVCDSLLARIPGMQVAIAVDGKLVWSEAFGFANLERHVPVTNTTQFRIGSVSKPLSATAVAMLVEQGQLDLDAPVQRYVPYFPQKPWPITTRQAAGHLAGIRHYRGNEFMLNRPFASVREGLAIFETDSLLFEPGTRFSYSSYGWNLVSAVIEGASGDLFLAYMSQNVLLPLGLTHTAPDRADSLIPDRTHFYDADSTGTAFRPAPAVDNSYKWAGGGFLSTAEDLVRLGSAFVRPGFLKAETLDLLFTTQRTRNGDPTGYGIGWFVTTDTLGHRWVFHGGGSVGGTTAFGVDRDSRIVFAVTTNLTEAPIGPSRRIMRLFDAAVSRAP